MHIPKDGTLHSAEAIGQPYGVDGKLEIRQREGVTLQFPDGRLPFEETKRCPQACQFARKRARIG